MAIPDFLTLFFQRRIKSQRHYTNVSLKEKVKLKKTIMAQEFPFEKSVDWKLNPLKQANQRKAVEQPHQLVSPHPLYDLLPLMRRDDRTLLSRINLLFQNGSFDLSLELLCRQDEQLLLLYQIDLVPKPGKQSVVCPKCDPLP